MIARIFLPLLLMILLGDLYVDFHFLRRKPHRLRRLLWWLPGLAILAYTVVLALQKDFAPSSAGVLNTYLFLLGFIVVPKFVFALCSVVGWGVRRLCHARRNYGHHVGVAFVLALWYVLFYGSTLGFSRTVVREVTFESRDLPGAFDGYRIVQFSDAHVGTYDPSRAHILQEAVQKMNGLKPDLVVFTGDIQNLLPSELYPHMLALSQLRAPDGVLSILGNHDYDIYTPSLPDSVRRANCREVVDLERHLGWTLLRNESRTIRRGQDSIVVGGMENWGSMGKGPRRGSVEKTLEGVGGGAFTVMLSHDPTAWRRLILPRSRAQLTLSGHTHAMQFELLGWNPASLIYSEWGGMFREGERAINVSTGLGGFLPFRFGVPGEIVAITLKCKK